MSTVEVDKNVVISFKKKTMLKTCGFNLISGIINFDDVTEVNITTANDKFVAKSEIHSKCYLLPDEKAIKKYEIIDSLLSLEAFKSISVKKQKKQISESTKRILDKYNLGKNRR